MVPMTFPGRDGEGRVNDVVPGRDGEGWADDMVPRRFYVEEE
jgi:hypothetical protein